MLVCAHRCCRVVRQAAQAPVSLQAQLDMGADRRFSQPPAAHQQALRQPLQQPAVAAQPLYAPQPAAAVPAAADCGGGRVQRSLFPVLSAAAADMTTGAN